LWDVALVEIFDPVTGATYALIDSYQGAAVLMLLGLGAAMLGLAGLLPDRGRRAATASLPPLFGHDAS
jgi:hypothetical protein